MEKGGFSYLVANEYDLLWGLYVTTIGFQSIGPGQDFVTGDHPLGYRFDPDAGRVLHEYQLVYVTAGEGMFQSASVSLRNVCSGSVLLLFPGEWHSYHPKRSIGWESYWIGFNGANMEQLIRGGFFSKKQAVLDIGFNEQVIGLYEQGMSVAIQQRIAFQPMLAGIASGLLGSVLYGSRNNLFPDKAVVAKIDEARVMMRNEAIFPEEIAQQLNMSYSLFRRVFKQYTGFSPAQYRMQIKVQRAKELLVSTTMPVKEIAYELNFESVSHFVAFFKAKVGVTPGGYRGFPRRGG